MLKKTIIKNILTMGVAVIFITMTSACGKNTSEDKNIESIDASQASEPEQSSLIDSVEETCMETNIEVLETSSSEGDLLIYYGMEEVTVEGKMLESSDSMDYDLNELIPEVYYEESDVKLYAYKSKRSEQGEKNITYSLLLEHGDTYQVFDKSKDLSFNNMYEYEEDLYNRSFAQGYEQDFDNDNEIELAEVIVLDYGTMILESAMIVFDFNSDTGKYDLYYIDDNDFADVIGKAAETFFDEFYGHYSINKYGGYEFDNGYVVSYGPYIRTHIDKNGVFTADVWMFGNPWGDGGMGNEIGSISLKIGYQGNGMFSVKAENYREWINIME